MFNCAICKEAVPPAVKPIIVTVGVRPVSYHNEFYVEDEWGNKELRKIDSVGEEATGEEYWCAHCAKAAEIDVPTQKAPTKPYAKFEEKQAESLRSTLIAKVVHNALDRLEHKSKRAQADCYVVVPGIKQFVDNNPNFMF